MGKIQVNLDELHNFIINTWLGLYKINLNQSGYADLSN